MIPKKTILNFSSLLIVQLLNYVLPLITLPIIVRIIGPEKFGIINYLSSIVAYFVLLIGFSFELSATRLVTVNRDDQQLLNLLFNQVLFAKITLFIISGIMFFSLLLFYQNLFKDQLAAIFTFLICIGTVFDSTWIFIAKQDVHQTAIFNLITKVLLNVSLLLFIRIQEDYIYQPLIMSLSQILVGFGAFIWALRRYNLKIHIPNLSDIWKLLWGDKVLFFHSFSHTIYTTLNIVILGFLKGPLEVGYYAAGWKLIILIQALLISPSTIVLFPLIGQAFVRKKEEGITVIQKLLPVVFIVTGLISIGVLAFGGVVVTFLYGNKFTSTIFIFKLLSFMPMMLALNMIFGIQTMVNLNMDKKFFSITLSAAFLSLLLNNILIRYWGAPGAALSWFITELFCTIAMFIVLTRNNIQIVKYQYFKFSIMKDYLILIIGRVKNTFRKLTF